MHMDVTAMLCPILCPGVPKTVPYCGVDGYHSMVVGQSHERAGNPSAPSALPLTKLKESYLLILSVSPGFTIRNPVLYPSELRGRRELAFIFGCLVTQRNSNAVYAPFQCPLSAHFSPSSGKRLAHWHPRPE
jgi:hypothetical protein